VQSGQFVRENMGLSFFQALQEGSAILAQAFNGSFGEHN